MGSGCCSSCGFKQCKCCGDFTVLEGPAIANRLVPALTGVADTIRNIATCLGARPYQVALIWTQWSEGERFGGTEQVLKREFLLPTPFVEDINPVRQDLQPIGIVEDGVVRVTQISPRYTEDYLMGRDAEGRPIPSDISFFWEIAIPRPNNSGVRRRFTPKSAPALFATDFEWRIDLLRAQQDRARNGDLR